MKMSFLFRGEQAPGREANARQRDLLVCEKENRCRFLNVVSRGETPRATTHYRTTRSAGGWLDSNRWNATDDNKPSSKA